MFDLDGTLLDTAPGIMWCLHRTFEKMALPDLTDEQLRPFIGPPLFESFETYCGLRGEENDQAVRIYRYCFEHEGGGKRLAYYEGLEDLLQTLSAAKNPDGSKRFRMFVATTKPEMVAEQVLREEGYDRYFEQIGGAFDDKNGSQKVDVIKRVLRRSGLATEAVGAGAAPYQSEAAKRAIAETLMIGDRFYDIRGAHLIGMKACAVRWGFGHDEEFLQWGADYIIDKPEDLLGILNGEDSCDA